MTDVEPVNSPGDWTPNTVLIDGKEYRRGWKTEGYWGGIEDKSLLEFALSGRYTRLKGIAGLTDDTPYTCEVGLKIYLDDKLATSSTIRLRHPTVIDLDVRGAIRLSFQFIGIQGCSALVALGDARLERLP